ncbi:MAG: transposase [Candidatus Dormibacteria bacterium]
MENRNALIGDMELSSANVYAERETALTLLRRLPTRARRRTVGGDKGYDTKDFVAGCRELRITPHVVQNTSTRRSVRPPCAEVTSDLRAPPL